MNIHHKLPTRGVLGLSIALAVAVMALPAHAVVYQWSTTVDDFTSPESKSHPRAFLWIPEQCKHVRAVVIAPQNMQEEQLFNHPAFRKQLAELDFAIVWVAPPFGNDFRFDTGDDKILEHVLADLADRSGYEEIRNAPLVPVGHSATASWCWDVAAWNPARTLAVISLSGQWPYFTSKNWGDRSVDGVPGLTTKGEYEIGGSLEDGWYAGLKGDFFTKHPHAAFSHVVEPGGDHFGTSDAKVELINLFLRKAAQYRIPAETSDNGSVTLKPIDAAKTGWLYEVWHLNREPNAVAAPVDQFKGKRDNAYWAFDEEMAHAIEKFQSTQRNKTNVLLGYRQKDGLTNPLPDHIEVHLKFEPIDDGLTFKLSGGFFDTVPPTKDGKPAGWQNMLAEGKRAVNQGDTIPHPQGEDEQLKLIPICGPVEQLSNDTFAIRFYRTGFDNPKRGPSIVFDLAYGGDEKFKANVERAEMRFPLKNTKGVAQTISFPRLADVNASSTLAPIQLQAKSSANAKVYYYVREGPAEVNDNGQLTFTAIPPRAKYPIPVTVVAWQWGRTIEPLLQSAAPVEQTFSVNSK